jgi:hypothetical protein
MGRVELCEGTFRCGEVSKEEFGLSREDAKSDNNFALRESCGNGHVEVVKYLKQEFVLGKEDAQSDITFH